MGFRWERSTTMIVPRGTTTPNSRNTLCAYSNSTLSIPNVLVSTLDRVPRSCTVVCIVAPYSAPLMRPQARPMVHHALQRPVHFQQDVSPRDSVLGGPPNVVVRRSRPSLLFHNYSFVDLEPGPVFALTTTLLALLGTNSKGLWNLLLGKMIPTATLRKG